MQITYPIYSNPIVLNKTQIKKSDVCFKSFPFSTKEIYAYDLDGSFFNTLVKYIQKAKFIPSRDKLTVLNVGCGTGDGTLGLISYFGRSDFGKTNNNVDVYGIDPWATHIQGAIKYYDKTLGQNAKFINGYLNDALKQNPHLKNNADVILVRHPDIFVSGQQCWLETIEDSFKNIRKDGLMVITTWDKDEMDIIKNFVKSKEYKIVVDEPNQLNYGADNYILIAQK